MSENPNHAVDLYAAAEHPPATGMHLTGQIDGGGGGAGQLLVAHDGHYEAEEEHLVEGLEEHEEREGMEVDGVAQQNAAGLGIIVPPGAGNQLTLSFQGEVYVFDSVSPEKVQAVLLLLGGRELTSGNPSTPSASQQNNKRSNFPQRVASLMRFREKRKERNFDKKIRYTVRKEVALRMQRHKGQFTSSKSRPEDASLGVTSWDSTQHWGAEDSRPQAASTCHHCNISAMSTPMMRRGPDGPRTLCNACGLMWANKGTLRDRSKNVPMPLQAIAPEPDVGSQGDNSGQPQPPAVAINGHDPTS